MVRTGKKPRCKARNKVERKKLRGRETREWGNERRQGTRHKENGGKKGAKGPKYKEKMEKKDIKGRIWRKGIRKGAKGQSMEKRWISRSKGTGQA
jgi:hypothetical protein